MKVVKYTTTINCIYAIICILSMAYPLTITDAGNEDTIPPVDILVEEAHSILVNVILE